MDSRVRVLHAVPLPRLLHRVPGSRQIRLLKDLSHLLLTISGLTEPTELGEEGDGVGEGVDGVREGGEGGGLLVTTRDNMGARIVRQECSDAKPGGKDS
jgi:hypothetical protein